jgi:hypothetical protein
MRIRKTEDGQRVMNGGNAEVCYPSYETICRDLNITDNAINKYNEILIKLDMLRYMNAGLWYFRNDVYKVVRESNNTYILYQEGWETELKDAIKFFKEQHKDERVFMKKADSNMKSINGYIGRINVLEQKGTATKEQLKKRDDLINLKRRMAENKKWQDNSDDEEDEDN